MATNITMATSTSYMEALQIEFGELFEFYDVLIDVNKEQIEEVEKQRNQIKNGGET